MSVENVSSGLVPQGQKASDYDNSDPVPPRQNVVPTAEKPDSSHQGLEFLFSPLLEEYYNPTHDQAEENNNDQAPNASFQEAEFINPFVHGENPLEQVRGNSNQASSNKTQLATDPEMFAPLGSGSDFCCQEHTSLFPILSDDCENGIIIMVPLKEEFTCSARRGLWYPRILALNKQHFHTLICRMHDTQKSTVWRDTSSIVISLTEYQLADMFTKALPEDRFNVSLSEGLRLDGGGGVTAVVTWGVWFGDDGEGDNGDVGVEMMMMWCVAAMVAR
ncbi:hypothetical protein Tco_0766915 [Tanacetum coccineum]